MEAKFIVNRLGRKEDSIAFAKVLYGKMQIYYGVLSLISWVLLVRRLQDGWRLRGLPFMLFTIAMTVLTFLYPRFMGWRMRKGGNWKVKKVEYTFLDEHLHVKSDVDEGVVQYGGFIKLAENEGYYYLFMQKYSAHIIPKRDFLQGDPAEFGAFISEKTGLTIKRVK